MHWVKSFWNRSFTDWRYRALLHLGFWIFLLFFWMRESLVIQVSWTQHIAVTITGIFTALFIYYPLVYGIAPLVRKRRWLSSLVVFMGYYLVAIALRTYHIQVIMAWYNLKHAWVTGQDFWRQFVANQLDPMKFFTLFFSSITSLLQIIFIPLIIKFIRYAYQFNLQQAWLAKENTQLQLSNLRAQINPHFFFNTLNNLQSFIVQNEKDKSVDLLSKLADFMRSSLYDCDSEWIKLSQEIDMLDNYLSIEKVRFDEDASINTSFEITDPDRLVPTFIFLPFIENAVKHSGTIAAIEVEIDIAITESEGEILLMVTNKHAFDANKQPKGRIGLANVKKRLDHYFHGGYSLNLDNDGTTFKVCLKIFKA